MESTIHVGDGLLHIEDVARVARGGAPVELTQTAFDLIRRGHERLTELLRAGEPIYGVNTGVGANISISIPSDQMEALQHNLLLSLSCGTGSLLPTDVVRASMLLRISTLATGTSGVRQCLVDGLVQMLNSHVTPLVPRFGSVGASGDLIPSAYVARALIGIGDCEYLGERLPTLEAFRRANLTPLTLAPKEGLSLVNGTSMMTAAASLLFCDLHNVLRALLAAAALAVEALRAPSLPYAPWVSLVKGHPGQVAVAAYMRALLKDSTMVREVHSQTCYSLRCIPQGLGPVWDSIEDGRHVVEREINSSNDNPLINPADGHLYRAGNFYGGHIARVLDGWKIDLATMANWANALMAILVDDRFSGLPPNLVPDPGVNSGFKGVQLSVTSLTCMVRQLASPSSIHSLPTEQYNQDLVSLGMHAAVTALDALDCVRDATAMILLAAVQAVDLNAAQLSMGEGTSAVHASVRSVVPFLDRDRAMENEIKVVSAMITKGNFALSA